jgi:uncharacterized membrane protein
MLEHQPEFDKMKTLLTFIGFLLLAMGLFWMGQGAGYIRWPAESFMISQFQWVYYGGGTALVGLILIVVARR